jgi:hypothetical protein
MEKWGFGISQKEVLIVVADCQNERTPHSVQKWRSRGGLVSQIQAEAQIVN